MAEEMYSHLFARQDAGSGGAPLIPPHPGTEKLNWTDAPRMLAVNGTLFALAMSCVLMRIYVRGFMLKSFGVDGMCSFKSEYLDSTNLAVSDWMMMFSAVCACSNPNTNNTRFPCRRLTFFYRH